jgi:TPR repeat protein
VGGFLRGAAKAKPDTPYIKGRREALIGPALFSSAVAFSFGPPQCSRDKPNGVAQNDLLAFDYLSRIANAPHGDIGPSAPEAQIAKALVALGRYYLNGVPNSKITSDPERAREMFSYAASYFGDADAQYDLARLYLKNAGTSRDDFRYGARWLGLAAQKGQHGAGLAGSDAVRWRTVAASGGAQLDVADARLRTRQPGGKLD